MNAADLARSPEMPRPSPRRPPCSASTSLMPRQSHPLRETIPSPVNSGRKESGDLAFHFPGGAPRLQCAACDSLR